MENKYLSKEVGKTEFKNFFDKLDHSISISRTHGIITDSEFIKARKRLLKKFASSLKEGFYIAETDTVLTFGDESEEIKKGDFFELVSIDKEKMTATILSKEYEYGVNIYFMANFSYVGKSKPSA